MLELRMGSRRQVQQLRSWTVGTVCFVEEFATNCFIRRGYQVLFTESVPFHVLFGTFMWALIQDPRDPKVRVMGFGERLAYQKREKSRQIWMQLPTDFRTPGYVGEPATWQPPTQ